MLPYQYLVYLFNLLEFFTAVSVWRTLSLNSVIACIEQLQNPSRGGIVSEHNRMYLCNWRVTTHWHLSFVWSRWIESIRFDISVEQGDVWIWYRVHSCHQPLVRRRIPLIILRHLEDARHNWRSPKDELCSGSVFLYLKDIENNRRDVN